MDQVQAGDLLDILDLLSFAQRFDATDPRDNVFALVGLANNHYAATQHVHPDYSKFARDVFLATAFELLLFNYENYQDMTLLRLSRKFRSRPCRTCHRGSPIGHWAESPCQCQT